MPIMAIIFIDDFVAEPGGIVKVAMLGYDLAWVQYIVLVLDNEVGGLHHTQGHHRWGLGTNLRKLVVMTFENSSNIQLWLNIYLLLYSYVLAQKQIPITWPYIYICACVCAHAVVKKCWFKHPLPKLFVIIEAGSSRGIL